MPTAFPATMRARDEDRANTATTLDKGLAEGQLSESEHSQRVSAAMTAQTLGDLHALIEDLQGDSDLAPMRAEPAVSAQSLRPRLSVPLAVAVALVIGAIVLVAHSCGTSSSRGSSGPAVAEFGKGGFLTPKGLTDIVAATRAEFGSTVVDDLTVYPDYAVVFRADPAAPRKQSIYRYDRKGFSDGSSSGGRNPADGTVDLAQFDPVTAARLIAGAGESLDLQQVDKVYLIVKPDDGEPQMMVQGSNELGESGHFTTTMQGVFTAVYPQQK